MVDHFLTFFRGLRLRDFISWWWIPEKTTLKKSFKILKVICNWNSSNQTKATKLRSEHLDHLVNIDVMIDNGM